MDMLVRILSSIFILLFSWNCGGRTPLLDLLQPGPSELVDPQNDGGFEPVDAVIARPDIGPLLDTGILVDAGFPLTPDASIPGTPDAGTSACEFGPERVCKCASGSIGSQACEGQGYGPCVCPPQAPLPDLTERQRLARIFDGMVGSWRGIGENRWNGEYPVTFNFRADRTYSARCELPNCVALYWAYDDDHPAKTYTMFDVFANGEGDGTLTLAGMTWGPQTGSMTNVYLSSDENYLRFDFFNTWSGRRIGPVSFILERD